MPNAGIIGGNKLAATFDRNIRLAGMPCTLYGTGVPQPDGTLTFPKLGTCYVMIQAGEKARDDAQTIGLTDQRSAMGYFTSTAKDPNAKVIATATIATDGNFVIDANGLLWKIHSLPSAQTFTGNVIGVGVLLTWEEVTPQGFVP